MPQKPFYEIQQDYEKFRGLNPQTQLDITGFAKLMDEGRPEPEHAAAYDVSMYDKLNAPIERTVDATGAPALAGAVMRWLGSGADKLLDTDNRIANVSESVGRGLPRMTAEVGATALVPGAAIPAWLARGAKVAGYGSAALRGAAETDSAIGGAISAGSLGLMNTVLPKLGQTAALKAAERLGVNAEGLQNMRYLPPLAKAAAEQAGAMGLGEATRQAQLTVTPQSQRTEGDRNPFTVENVAGNVAGSLAFAPLIARDVLRAPKTPYKLVKEVANERQQELNLDQPTVTADSSRDQRMSVLLKTELDAYDNLLTGGNIDETQVERSKQRLTELFSSMDKSQLAPEVLQQAKDLDVVARMTPPGTPAELQKFWNDVTTLIDTWNSVTKREGAGGPEEGAKQSYHPAARDPAVVARLQKEGLLPQITEQWLKDTWNFTFDRSIGDPEFAWRATVQKTANYLLDNIEGALAREDVKAKSGYSPAVQKENMLNRVMVDSLLQLPNFDVTQADGSVRKFRDLVAERYAKISSEDDIVVQGRPRSRLASFRDAVIQAGQTFDPMTNTFKFSEAKKDIATKQILRDAEGKVQRNEQIFPLQDLLAEKGKPFLKYRSRTQAQGGKPDQEVAMPTQEPGRVPETFDELADTDMPLYSEVEGTSLMGLQRESVGSGLERLAQEYTNLGANAERAPEVRGESTAMADLASKLQVALGRTEPTAVWNKVKDMYEVQTSTGIRRDPMNEQRHGRLKLALEAALETYGRGAGSGKAELGPKATEFLEWRKSMGFQTAETTPYRQFEKALDPFLYKAGMPEVGGRNRIGNALVEIFKRLVGEDAVKPLLERTKQAPSASPSYGRERAPDETIIEYVNVDTANTEQRIKAMAYDNASRIFGAVGYSGSLRDFYSALATKMFLAKWRSMGEPDIALQRLDTNDPLAEGLAGTYKTRQGEVVGALGVQDKLASNERGKLASVRDMQDYVQVIVHELQHIDEFIMQGRLPRPDAYSDQRMRQVKAMYSMASVLKPEERNDILMTMYRAFKPESLLQFRWEQGKENQFLYGSFDANEFVAELNGFMSQVVAQGTPRELKSVENVLRFMAPEVIEYQRGFMRSMHDVLQASSELFKNPDIAQAGGLNLRARDSAFTSQAYKSALTNAERLMLLDGVDVAGREARNVLTGVDKGVMVRPPVDVPVWTRAFSRDYEMQELPKATPTGVAAIKETQRALFGDPTEGGTKAGALSRWLYPFTNLMHKMERAGVPLASDVLALANQTFPSIGRAQTYLLAPFLSRDSAGRPVINGENPLIVKIAQDRSGPWRKTLNNVRQWQNANEQVMFTRDEKGALAPKDDKAAKAWAKFSKNLSPEDQATVINASLNIDETYNNSRGLLLTSLMQSTQNRTAALFMQMNKSMQWDQARGLAAEAVQAFQSGDVSRLAGKVDPKQLETVGNLLVGETGLLKNYQRVQQHLDKRSWFSSESLPGDWIIRFRNEFNEVKYLSGRSKEHATQLAQKLMAEGMKIEGEIVNKKDLRNYMDFDNPADVLEKFQQTEQRSWEQFLNTIKQSYGEPFVEELRAGYVPGATSVKEMAAQGIGRYMQERKGKVDTTRLDYIDSMVSYVEGLAAATQYRSVREQLALIMRDPRGLAFPTFKSEVAERFNYLMSPTPSWLSEVRGALSAYYLGANLSSTAIEGTQSMVSLVPILISEAPKGGPVKAYQTMLGGAADAFKFSRSNDWVRIAAQAEVKAKRGEALTSDETIAHVYQRAVQDGVVDHGVIQDLNFGRDQRLLMAKTFGHGDYGEPTKFELARNKVYLAGQVMMRLYSWMSLMNNKVAVTSATRLGIEKGLTGQELYNYVLKVKNLATFGGGKANAPGYLAKVSTDATRSAFGIMNTLQQYGLGMVATYAELGRDAIGRTKGLTPAQKSQAQKAFGTLLATQLAVGGALSMPFAAAGLAFLEKRLGIPANQLVREGLQSLAGDDDELGRWLSNLALNGAGSQLTGLNLSNRVGVSSLFGVNAYDGFNAADVFGPVGGVAENMVTALNEFGQNNPMKAARNLVPAAFKNAVDLIDSETRYGDMNIRDASQNLLYRPTDPEKIAIALGFRPQAVADKRLAQSMMATARERYQSQRDQMFDAAAQGLLQGQPAQAQQLGYNALATDPTGQRRLEVLRSLVDRAGDMTHEKDLLASGGTDFAPAQRKIARLVGPDVVPRQSEVALFQLRQKLAASLGEPRLADPTALDRAVMIDSLVQQGGMTRAEAVRLASFLSR